MIWKDVGFEKGLGEGKLGPNEKVLDLFWVLINKALAGSPLIPRPILSTSSISTRGFPSQYASELVLSCPVMRYTCHFSETICSGMKEILTQHKSFDLCYICQTTDIKSEKPSAKSSRNTFPNRSLANTRRSNETDYLSLNGTS